MITHPIEPVFNEKSQVLILGSFPSVKSREQGFFYGHPQNRFWKVVAAVFDIEVPDTIDKKRKLLLDYRIAVWDVIASCEITGSSDSSIRSVIPNDLSIILKKANIKQVFVNGKTAEKFYNKYILKNLRIPAVCLPSTSPANAAWKTDMLVEKWSIIKDFIN